LDGVVEVDEPYWGEEETGAIGWGEEKALIIFAAQEDAVAFACARYQTRPA
jgi:hypothetical protein